MPRARQIAGISYSARNRARQLPVEPPVPPATVPEAFTVDMWTLAATGVSGQLVLNITTLPNDGGSPLTALQYRLDGGEWITLVGVGTGEQLIDGLTDDTEYAVDIRSENAVGFSANSDVKTATPVTV